DLFLRLRPNCFVRSVAWAITGRRNPTGLAAKVLATIQVNPKFFHELAAH
ncbi:hypothetical protein KKY33_004896, partial [Escherichia coli]|nr:hypothetical protein [Escherichia coli]EIP0586732.1 hypothetical protein [Escherichia coli]EIP7745661.1 hypothetical protein [Escherichia coli]